MTAPSPSLNNVLQWNGVMWQNAIVGNVWNDGFAATLNTNAVALRGATDPVFTDTTYNLNTTADGTNAQIRLRDGDTDDDADSIVTLSPGNNISFSVSGRSITISAPNNFADSRVYDSTAARNAVTDVVWHEGDIAIVDGGSTYFYTGNTSGDAHSGATVDDDWQVLVTPTDELDAARVLSLLNDNDGTTDIRAELLPNIPDSLLSSNVLTTTSSITDLGNVRLNSDTTKPLSDHDFLQYNSTVNMWENVPAEDFLTVTPFTARGGGALSYDTANQEFQFRPAAVSGLPSAPERESAAIRYELVVPETGSADSVDWMEIEAGVDLPAAPGTDTAAVRYELNVPATGSVPDAPTWVPIEEASSVTVSDVSPTGPEEGDLWYYTGGDDEAGNEPGLFVWYEDADGTGNWTSTTSMYTVPAAPTEPAEDTSYNLQVTTDGEASWEPVADSGGGGGSAPTDSTFITSAAGGTTSGGGTWQVLTLTAGTSPTQFYMNGGVEFQPAKHR